MAGRWIKTETAKKILWFSAAKLQHHIGGRSWGAGCVEEDAERCATLGASWLEHDCPSHSAIQTPPIPVQPSNQLLAASWPCCVCPLRFTVLKAFRQGKIYFTSRTQCWALPEREQETGAHSLLCLRNASSWDLRDMGKALLKTSSKGWSLCITTLLHHPSSIELNYSDLTT